MTTATLAAMGPSVLAKNSAHNTRPNLQHRGGGIGVGSPFRPPATY